MTSRALELAASSAALLATMIPKNLIINGDFDHDTYWEGNIHDHQTHVLDYWRASLTYTGGFERKDFSPADTQLAALGIDPEHYLRFTADGNSHAAGATFLRQYINDVNSLPAGEKFTSVSYARANRTMTLENELFASYDNTLTDLNAIGSGTLTLTTSWQRLDVVGTQSLHTGKSYGAGHGLISQWNISDETISGADYVDVMHVSLGVGDLRHLVDCGGDRTKEEERNLCRGRIQKSFGDGVVPDNGASATVFADANNVVGITNQIWAGTPGADEQHAIPLAWPMEVKPIVTRFGNSNGHWAWIHTGASGPASATGLNWSTNINVVGHPRRAALRIANNVSTSVIWGIQGHFVARAEPY